MNTYSLETEIVASGNADLLKMVFMQIHERSEAKWDDAVGKTGDDRAKSIQVSLNQRARGDFAQILAEKIREGAVFSVPAYIRDAIEGLVE